MHRLCRPCADIRGGAGAVQGAVQDINACALLNHLQGTQSPELQHAIAVVIAALSPLLTEPLRELWTGRLLQWLCHDQKDEALR